MGSTCLISLNRYARIKTIANKLIKQSTKNSSMKVDETNKYILHAHTGEFSILSTHEKCQFFICYHMKQLQNKLHCMLCIIHFHSDKKVQNTKKQVMNVLGCNGKEKKEVKHGTGSERGRSSRSVTPSWPHMKIVALKLSYEIIIHRFLLQSPLTDVVYHHYSLHLPPFLIDSLLESKWEKTNGRSEKENVAPPSNFRKQILEDKNTDQGIKHSRKCKLCTCIQEI